MADGGQQLADAPDLVLVWQEFLDADELMEDLADEVLREQLVEE